jgi:hypothetical protein
MMKTSNILQQLFSSNKQSFFHAPHITIPLNPNLSLSIQFHTLQLPSQREQPVITFQSQGFYHLNQNELVFMIQYNNSNDEKKFLLIFDEFRGLLEQFYEYIQSNNIEYNYFDPKRVTVFDGTKFCSLYKAVVYTHFQLPHDSVKPEFNRPYMLLIGLLEEEYHYVSRFGICRLLTQFAKVSKLYPCHIYNSLEPTSIVPTNILSSNNSLLSSIYQITSIPNVFVKRSKNGSVTLEICENSHEHLTKALEQHKSTSNKNGVTNFAIHCDMVHLQCNTHLVHSGDVQNQKEEYISTTELTDDESEVVGGSYCAFFISNESASGNSVSVVTKEDGFCVACSPSVWNKHIYKSLMNRQNTNFWNETTKEIIFSIRWISSRYVTFIHPDLLLQNPKNSTVSTENPMFQKRLEKKFVSLHAFVVVSDRYSFVKRLSITGQRLIVQTIRSYIESALQKKLKFNNDLVNTRVYFKLFVKCYEDERKLEFHCANDSSDKHFDVYQQIVKEMNSETFNTGVTGTEIDQVLQIHLVSHGSSLSFVVIFNICHKHFPTNSIYS